MVVNKPPRSGLHVKPVQQKIAARSSTQPAFLVRTVCRLSLHRVSARVPASACSRHCKRYTSVVIHTSPCANCAQRWSTSYLESTTATTTTRNQQRECFRI